jgi:hypothetical protein
VIVKRIFGIKSKIFMKEMLACFSDKGRVCMFFIDGDVIDGEDQHDQ